MTSITAVLTSQGYDVDGGAAQPVTFDPSTGLLNADGFPVSSMNGFATGVVASAGDSTAAAATYAAEFSYGRALRMNDRGALVWALTFSGHPFDFKESDNYAVGGTTTEHLRKIQLPQLLGTFAAGRKYVPVYVSSGTNDYANNLSAKDTCANLKVFFDEVRNRGMQPMHPGIRPRGTSGRAITNDTTWTPIKAHAAYVNAWLADQAGMGYVDFPDATELYADNSTAFGNMLATMGYDGLHGNAAGNCLEGKLIANMWARKGIRPAMRFATIQGDTFSRANNPRGVINANPLLQGGTTAPTGWTSSGGTWSKATRTLPNGQTRSDPSCALAQGATHYIDWTAFGAGGWSGDTSVAPGDVIEARALIKLNNASGIQRVYLHLFESDGVNALTHGGLFYTSGDTSYTTLPLDGNEYLYLRTPQITVRPYGGASSSALQVRPVVVTNSGVGGGSFDVLACETRPILLGS